MTKLSIYLLSVVLFSILPLSAQSAEDYDLYLLIGQSNMAGRAKVTPELQGEMKDVFLLDDKGEWVAASNPMNRFSTIRKDMKMQRLGPGYSFALEMAEASKKPKIGLIVNARGGTKIQQWAKGESFYEALLERVKLVEGHGRLKGILWHQGEGNSNDEDYLEKLKEMVKDLRTDLGDQSLPLVVGQIFKDKPINVQLARVSEEIQNTACVSAKDLTSSDGTHFDTQGQLELGKRYAKAMLKLQKKVD